MLSKNARDMILKTTVALTVGFASVVTVNYKEPVMVEAATVINQTQGVVTVKASSIWTYSKAEWSARTKVFSQGTKFNVLQKVAVSGREMYRLDNGLYISANPTYVSFKASSGSVVTTPPVNTEATLTTGKTTVNLNMRTGAGTSNGIILTIPKGGSVTVHSTSNGWSNVTYNGKKGWVSAKYLSTVTAPAPVTPTTPTAPTTPEPPKSSAEAVQTGKTSVNLNMRSGIGTSNGIILTIPKGGSVTIHATSNGWHNVTYNGKKGWVSGKYVTSITTVTPSTPTTPAPSAPVVSGVIGTSKTTANLNMRTGIGTSNGIILTIPKSGEVSIYSTSNGWANVTYNGKKGWVSAKYLTTMVAVAPPVVEKPKEETPAPPVNPAPTTPEEPKEETPVVVKKPAVLLIDESKNTYNNENINIVGRAVTMDGVTEVTATINGKSINVERYERPELNTLYGEGYTLEKIGFKFTIDKSTLPVGHHTLVISSKAKDGTVKKITSTIRMDKPAPVMTINGITDGQNVPTSNVAISGYAVHVDGVTGMKYYVNGKDKGAINYGAASSDTGSFSSYTGYKNANYSFTLNAQDLSPTGMNSVRIEMIGKDGTLYAKTYILKGTQVEGFTEELQTKSRDEYAILETGKSVWPKISRGGFVNATFNDIQYHLDPGNFIYDEENKYMFMDLRYDAEMNVTAAQLDNMLNGKGVLHGMGEAFVLAGQKYGVNPIYLASHAILETGHGTSVLSKGQKVTETYTKFGDASTIVKDSIPEEDKDKLVYNVFGIGAWDVNPNLWGAQKAYTEKWFTVEEAIMGGAKWIGENYINRQSSQNTLFKMRFNFPENMGHEYATDLGWAQKQAKRIKEQIELYMLKNPDANLNLKFYYPKFK